MFYTTTTKFSVHYDMKQTEGISVGTIIKMTRTGKTFVVDDVTPDGVILMECTRRVSFSHSALNTRIDRGSAKIIKH